VGWNFLLCDRDLKMPPDVREWLPPEHLCWKMLDVVGEVDLSAFEGSYRADGQGAAYPPTSLVALILYCYSKEFGLPAGSSRRAGMTWAAGSSP
jgi:hypothetical protein